MKKSFEWVIVVFCFVISSACVVRVPQLDRLTSILNSTESADQDAYTGMWTAKVDDYGAVVSVYEVDGLFIFVSDEGDAVAFDGWNIKSLVGFGIGQMLTISVSNNLGATRDSNTSNLRCSKWTSQRLKNEEILWRQTCSSHHNLDLILRL